MSKIFLSLVFTFFPILFVHANLADEFSNFYYSKNISARHCGANVASFIKHLATNGYDTSNVRALKITAPNSRWGFGQVISVNSRWGRFESENYHQNWSFHVVALIEGNVYDFSFNQMPLIRPFKNYIQEMFIPKVPFAIYGDTFSIGGVGPYYSSSEAQVELQKYHFETYSVDTYGNFYLKYSANNLSDFINSFD